MAERSDSLTDYHICMISDGRSISHIVTLSVCLVQFSDGSSGTLIPTGIILEMIGTFPKVAHLHL